MLHMYVCGIASVRCTAGSNLTAGAVRMARVRRPKGKRALGNRRTLDRIHLFGSSLMVEAVS